MDLFLWIKWQIKYLFCSHIFHPQTVHFSKYLTTCTCLFPRFLGNFQWVPLDSIASIYEAVLKGKLHQGYHQLDVFRVFLQRVVGKLSKPLSGHNSKRHVASTAGVIFAKHSSAPQPSSLCLCPSVSAFFQVCEYWRLEVATCVPSENAYCGLHSGTSLQNWLHWSLERSWEISECHKPVILTLSATDV